MTKLYPMDFGAIGDGITDDHSSLQACMNAAGALCGATVVVDRMYATSLPVIVPDFVHVVGDGGSAGFIAIGSADIQGLLRITGSTTTGPSLGWNAVKYQRFLSMSAPIPIGTYLRIDATINDPATYNMAFTTKIHHSAASDINLGFLLPFNFYTTNQHTVSLLTMRTGVCVSGLNFKNGNATGNNVGIWATNIDETCSISRCFFSELRGGGAIVSSSYGASIEGLTMLRCGGTEVDFGIYACTAMRVRGVFSDKSQYFGPMFSGVHHSTISEIICNFANGRGIKINGCSMNVFFGLIVNRPENSGISLQNHSCSNVLSMCQANGSSSSLNGDGIGIKDNGEHNLDNVVSLYSARNNISGDASFQPGFGTVRVGAVPA